MYPALRRWLNQCVICQNEGPRPDLPTVICMGMAADNLRRLFRPLPLHGLGRCVDCQAVMQER